MFKDNMKKFTEHFFWTVPFFVFIFGYLVTRSIFHVSFIKTPAITGLNLEMASKILSDQNLNLRILSEKEDKFLEPGTIVSQTPISGAKIKPNQSLFVIITKKPNNFTYPKIEGLEENEGLEALKAANIKPKIFYLNSIYPKKHCFGQFPQNGEPIENLNNPSITLYVSNKTKRLAILPNLKNYPVEEITQFFDENGLKYKIFHSTPVGSDHTCKGCLITDQRPLPGTLVEPEKPNLIYLIAK